MTITPGRKRRYPNSELFLISSRLIGYEKLHCWTVYDIHSLPTTKMTRQQRFWRRSSKKPKSWRKRTKSWGGRVSYVRRTQRTVKQYCLCQRIASQPRLGWRCVNPCPGMTTRSALVMPLVFLLVRYRAELRIKTVESVTVFGDNGKAKDPQVELVFKIRDVRSGELEPRIVGLLTNDRKSIVS